MISLVKKHLPSHIALHVLIRPRGGDFCYSTYEYEVMALDIEHCKRIGVDGVVIGVLRDTGDVDVDRTKQLVELAKPMNVTFHRAFDMVRDPYKALEDIIAIGGISRVTAQSLIELLAK